jgi:UDP-glucose 4-epimerase
MKALVTGGAGFIGSNLVDNLVRRNFEVLCVDNESSDGHDFFYWNSNAKNYKIDICDFGAIAPLFKDVDYVFHLAAEARIMNCINNPLKAINTNIVGTANVLQASRENGIKRVVYSSTSSAYGNNSVPNNESQKDDCLNPYSVSKVSGEKLCSMYTALFGVQTIILRYFNVYGNRQPVKGQYAPVLGLFLSQKMNHKPLTIVGDGIQRRDFTNIFDVVEANLKAALTDIDNKFFGTVFNVGSGTNHSILEIAKMISSDYVFIEKRPGEMSETLADINKIKSVLGWEPTMLLEDWILSQKT